MIRIKRSHKIGFAVVFVLLGVSVLLGLARWEWSEARLTAPSPSQYIVDRHGHFIADVNGDETHGNGYWQLNSLPERVAEATLALEDGRFWSHPGIDPLAIGRAVLQNAGSGRRVSGASTIAMQVARLQQPKPRTYLNKAREAVRAVFLTLRHGRDAVFRHYLRIVPYANNSHGIAYVARRYLDKPLEDLSWAEIAFLSAIPQAPSNMNPFHVEGRKRAINRGKRILLILREKEVLNATDYDLARQQIERLRFPHRPRRPIEAMHAIDQMQRQLRSLDSQGRRIESTLDLDVQRMVHELVTKSLDDWRDAGARQISVIVTNAKNGEILSWIGSADYFSADAGALDFATVSRSPGSTLKPFLFALALERGVITPTTILDDLAYSANGFRNADRRFLGPMLPRQALANSRNVPAIRLLERIGLDEGYRHLQSLGLHNSPQDAQHFGLGMAIGGIPTSLERLVGAYGSLANDGVLNELSWFKGLGDKKARRVMSRETARLITSFLSDSQARLPSFPRMGTMEFRFPVALKTGTSQGYRDAWTIGYSKDYVVGVWVGRPDARPMENLGGSASAAKLVGRILKSLHPQDEGGLRDLSFPAPDGYHSVGLCTRTGQRDIGQCDSVLLEWLRIGDDVEVDDSHHMLAIDSRNGLLASPWTPQQFTRNQKFISLSPVYARWAANNGFPIPPSGFSLLDLPPDQTIRDQTITAAKSGQDAFVVEGAAHLTISSPNDGLHFVQMPDMPAALQQLALRAEVYPPTKQVLWYVDGEPFKLAGPPYNVHWPLKPGRHVFEVGLPGRQDRSQPVTAWVD